MHCWAPLQAADELLLDVLDGTLEEVLVLLDVAELVEEGTEDNVEVLLEVAALVEVLLDVDVATLVATLEVETAPPQIAPLTVGVSIAPPLASTCTPKVTF